MNNLDKQYIDLVDNILRFGTDKTGRNGKTKSIFGYTIRHNMKNGFPLLTTKKMAWKQVVTELLWFLKGDTNIKYLVDNGCHIWDGDAYKAYVKRYNKGEYVGKTKLLENSKKNRTLTEPFTQEEFINKIKTDDEFAEKWGDLGSIYGKQWRSWDVPKILTIDKGKIENGIGTEWGSWERNPIDQIQNLINDLKTNPDSRRLMVSAWNVSDLDNMVLPPCHYGFQCWTRELSIKERLDLAKLKYPDIVSKWDLLYANAAGAKEWFDSYDIGKLIPTRAISLMWNQRSVDVPLGLPFNIASYGLLLHILAEATNMIPDELIGNLGDCHIYENQIDGIKQQLDRTPYELPSLRINTEFWPTESGECGIGPLTPNIDHLIKEMQVVDFQIENYKYHPAIKMPLSN